LFNNTNNTTGAKYKRLSFSSFEFANIHQTLSKKRNKYKQSYMKYYTHGRKQQEINDL